MSTPSIRVLVVDDAAVVRRIVREAIDAEDDLEVVGTAANGRIALDRIAQLSPDVVTLDIEMPELDGLQTLEQVRRTQPRLPVIMFSTLTERGATATVDALLRGANDYVTKPSNTGSFDVARRQVRDDLVPKIRHLAARARRPAHTPASAPRPRPRPGAAAASGVEMVAIGVSTGGPNALASLVPSLPADLEVPVVVVQHMPPMFTRLLAERLDQTSPLSVREAVDGAPLRPGTLWIARGGHHLLVRPGVPPTLELGDGPPEHSCRPAADVLLRSAVDAYGPGVLGVILTGMGSDGLRGCELIRAAGGRVLAQDRATSVVWGMPGSVVQRGLADEVLPLEAMAETIVARVRARTSAAARGAPRGAGGAAGPAARATGTPTWR